MSNPLLGLLATVLATPIANVKAGLESVIATPTVENVTKQVEVLGLDAIDPAQLEGASFGNIAQEALNVVNAIEAYLAVSTTAPSAAVATTVAGS